MQTQNLKQKDITLDEDKEVKEQRIRQAKLMLDKRLNGCAELKVKMIIIGSYGVGKTSLMRKYLDSTADIKLTKATILVDMEHAYVRLANRGVGLRIWDTAGTEKYQEHITNNYYRNAQAVMFVFSLADVSSFRSLPKWVSRARQFVMSDFECCLVGNKSDVGNKKRMVSSHEAREFANWEGMPYTETSALNSFNVQKAFNDLVLCVIRRHDVSKERDSSTIRLKNGRNANAESCRC